LEKVTGGGTGCTFLFHTESAVYLSLSFIERRVHSTAANCTTELCRYHQYCTAGWRRCIGCLKLQVSFRKKATNYRTLLWKITSKDKASYGSSPPCTLLCRCPHHQPLAKIPVNSISICKGTCCTACLHNYDAGWGSCGGDMG